jgi:hypothetical protein
MGGMPEAVEEWIRWRSGGVEEVEEWMRWQSGRSV